MDVEKQKRAAAQRAAGLVEDGMTVGLGSGTTAALVVEALGKRVGKGLEFVGVPTSTETRSLAEACGIPLTRLEACDRPLDLTIDGADEVDPALNLVKGRGGALLWEKIVAKSSQRYVIVVDEGKLVDWLGEHAPLPVEIVTFGWNTTRDRLAQFGIRPELRGGTSPYLTNSGNFIVDCMPGEKFNPFTADMAAAIKNVTGVVEHGLFMDMHPTVVVGRESGSVDVLTP
jgi:ribose 5-phosphate isomerase A